MRILVILLIWTIPFSAYAAEAWVGVSPWFFTGDRNDKICDDEICMEVDSRIEHAFEFTMISGEDSDSARMYFNLGWVRGECGSECSYTFAGVGGRLRPFDDVERFILEVGVESGRETIHHSEVMRFRLALLYAPRSSRWYAPDLIGWCHRSTGRKLAGLGSDERNEALDSLCLSYRVVE